uniref:Transposase n=1 Tax=Heterorhabditis bacteriophora TaxID=37862 RepID=A0A1I7WMK8_HETBA
MIDGEKGYIVYHHGRYTEMEKGHKRRQREADEGDYEEWSKRYIISYFDDTANGSPGEIA